MTDQAFVTTYREQGFAVARSVFSAAEIEALRTAADELEDRARSLSDDTFDGVTFFALHRPANPFAKDISSVAPVKGLLRRVTYAYAISKTFDRFRAHPRLLAHVAALIGPDLKQIVNQVNFNPSHSASGWGWHQDYRFRKAGIVDVKNDFVQTITALDVCSTVTGGLRVIPKSVELGPLKLDQDNENAESHFDAKAALTPELKPGDVIFFNSYLIHGSTANNSPSKRRVYINGYVRATSKVGMPVMKDGEPIPTASGAMEYEGDRELLPKASKY